MRYKTVTHAILRRFAEDTILNAGMGVECELPSLRNYSPHWKKAFRNFAEWYERFQTGGITKADREKIFARKGNNKLPFLSFSSMPFSDCPGKGDCESICYSPKGWRNVHPFFKQLRNSILMRYAFREIEREMRRILALPSMNHPTQKGFSLHPVKTPTAPLAIPFRLFVDGDFPNGSVLIDWMTLLETHPRLKCYGYSKSWEVLLSYRHSWPENYRLNLSSGSRYSPQSGIARAVSKLACVRGSFIYLGKKKRGTEYKSPEYNREARALAKGAGLTRAFVCPGTCGTCTPKGHFCGSNNPAPVVILAH